MTPQPIAQYRDGQLWTLHAGSYVLDPYGWDTVTRLMTYRAWPEQFLTDTDRQRISELTAALRARREAEGEQ